MESIFETKVFYVFPSQGTISLYTLGIMQVEHFILPCIESMSVNGVASDASAVPDL